MDFDRAERVRRELGIDRVRVVLPIDFDDPAFSRRVLDLDAPPQPPEHQFGVPVER